MEVTLTDFGWVKIENSYDYITKINNQNIIINDGYFDFEAAYKNITFADGIPFGVKDNIPKKVQNLNIYDSIYKDHTCIT